MGTPAASLLAGSPSSAAELAKSGPHITRADVLAIIAEVAERAGRMSPFEDPTLRKLAEAAKEAKGG